VQTENYSTGSEKAKRSPAVDVSSWLDESARYVLILPAVVIVLVLSIFPLLVSLYLALSRFKFVKGGFEITFVGPKNFEKLLAGSEQRHFLGKFSEAGSIPITAWLLLGIAVGVMLYLLYGYVRRSGSEKLLLRTGIVIPLMAVVLVGANTLALPLSIVMGDVSYWLNALPVWMSVLLTAGVLSAFFLAGAVIFLLITIFGFTIRVLTILFASALLTLLIFTLNGQGLPGTLVVTLIFVFGGVTLQYLIGLGLGLLLTQNLPGKRFFRVVFLLPMMITPVGIGFLFRMMTDTIVGPFSLVWRNLGLVDYSMLGQGDTARLAVIIGDTWQWTPFMFIILLAALEGVSKETIEAALVDGASRLQMFRYIILPEVIPVSTTVILIRLIESFKIIDMPNILTGGGPGTATESITLQAYVGWRASDLGGSAALAYLLLIVSTFTALVFVNFIRRRLLEWTA
jgi:ABC-type sugar transport system permease subunit